MRATIVSLLAAASLLSAEPRPWQRIQVPTVSQAAAQFQNPPPEHALTVWWFWNGPMTESDITRDLRELRDHGVRSLMLWPYYGITFDYLSPTWFERVRYAVGEAKRLDMRIWLMDEGGYPSGFAGGKITDPKLQMRVLDERGMPIYRTSPTRHVNRPGFPKDRMYSLFDALNPAGTQKFLELTHEQYKKYIGGEFGKTVMGFMGDEPSFPGQPWTDALPAEFLKRKGYDLQPYLPKLKAPENRLVRADYFDVWTQMYSDHFFQMQSDWCAQNGLDYTVHLCGEEDLKTLVELNGDYFRCSRTVTVPQVDAIWRQIWPDTVPDYPKLASSVAHLYGRPRASTESFAVYGNGLSLEQAKWVMDFQFVRGINHFQAMEYLSAKDEFRLYFHPPDWASSPLWPYFPQLANYANRVSYLLSQGRPAAQIALYFPTTSAWLGDLGPYEETLKIARKLLDRQYDFDFVEDDSLASVLTNRDKALWNRSGQAYRAVIVPPVTALSRGALAKLEQFAATGGQLMFLGHAPLMIPDRTYLHASREAPPWVASHVVKAIDWNRLPASDVVFTAPAADIRYLHRNLADGEIYFFFNQGTARTSVKARLAGKGVREIWDPVSGTAALLPADGSLLFEPYESKVVIIRGASSAPKWTAPADRLVTQIDSAGWQLELNGEVMDTTLRSWSELGRPGFFGAARYRKKVRLDQTQGLTLDLGEVRYAARVKWNGKDLGGRGWRPYRWSLDGAAKMGENEVEIEVSNTRANDLAGNPERQAEIEKKGWLHNSYIKMYGKFDLEMVPSGLMGPVRILKR